MRTRTLARVAAVQALYQAEFQAQSVETVIDQFVRHRIGVGALEDGRLSDADVPLFAKIARTAAAQAEMIDGMLVAALPQVWPLNRIDPVLRALMRAGGAELWMAEGPPGRVIINEYMDVAHGFFAGDEPKMANGVLDRLAHLLRPAEFVSSSSAAG
jgi:N utilization substance protein B